MKHLKLFNDVASYEAWKNSEDYVLPNVSYTEGVGLYYNPVKNLLTITLNVPDVSNPTKVCYKTEAFSEMIIDGVSMQPTQTYQFTSPGYHTIEYELIDKKHIPDYCFFQGPFPGGINVQYIEKLVIPEGVETIGYGILPQGQYYLKSVEFPSTFNGVPNILGDGHSALNIITFKCPPENILLDSAPINVGIETREVIVNYPSKYDYSEVIKYLNDNNHSVVFIGETID